MLSEEVTVRKRSTLQPGLHRQEYLNVLRNDIISIISLQLTDFTLTKFIRDWCKKVRGWDFPSTLPIQRARVQSLVLGKIPSGAAKKKKNQTTFILYVTLYLQYKTGQISVKENNKLL